MCNRLHYLVLCKYTLAQRRNRLTTPFSERIPVVKRRVYGDKMIWGTLPQDVEPRIQWTHSLSELTASTGSVWLANPSTYCESLVWVMLLPLLWITGKFYFIASFLWVTKTGRICSHYLVNRKPLHIALGHWSPYLFLTYYSFHCTTLHHFSHTKQDYKQLMYKHNMKARLHNHCFSEQ